MCRIYYLGISTRDPRRSRYGVNKCPSSSILFEDERSNYKKQRPLIYRDLWKRESLQNKDYSANREANASRAEAVFFETTWGLKSKAKDVSDTPSSPLTETR